MPKFLCRSSTVPKFGYPGQQTSADSTVRIMSWSRFSPKDPVRCLSAVRIFCQVHVSSDFASLDFISWSDSVRILRKKAVRCLSARSDKNETKTRQFLITLLSFWFYAGVYRYLLSETLSKESPNSSSNWKRQIVTYQGSPDQSMLIRISELDRISGKRSIKYLYLLIFV